MRSTDRAREIQRLSKLLLAWPFDFRFPEAIDEGARFSSDPDANPSTLGSWTQRADAGIHQGRLWLLCFRREPSIIGYYNNQQWFPDEFRKKLSP